jgi:hypothetical protein
MMDDEEFGTVGGMFRRGNYKYLEKTCPNSVLSTTGST